MKNSEAWNEVAVLVGASGECMYSASTVSWLC